MKKDIKVLLILSSIFLLILLICVGINNIYGSTTDWAVQHIVFPDYFRNLFYSTGDLTPNLALNLGAGQNIYYFSYYGLLNPFILLSYLFPFVKMIDYMIIISILIVIASAFLIYKWLVNNKYDRKMALVCSILFLLMTSFSHAHRHIMFINYMPFLILGLMGIDKYFDKGKKTLFILSVFLMIMTSYYYSVGGILCMIIYGIYKYFKETNKKGLKSFFLAGFKFAVPIIIGILMSCILLIPTFLAIVGSRSSAVKESYNLASLLLPNLNIEAILYSNYGMGFTSIALIALIFVILNGSKRECLLSCTLAFLFSIPFVMYILNGALYLRGKVLIPFAPLFVIVLASFFKLLKKKTISASHILIASIIILILAYIFDYQTIYFYIDIALTSIFLIIYTSKIKKSYIIYIPIIIIALISNIVINEQEKYISKEDYNVITSSDIEDDVDNIKEEDQSFYRMESLINDTYYTTNKIYTSSFYQTSLYSSTYNSYYHNFYNNVISNNVPYRNNLILSTPT
ncbi:MAG: YfhO family protein, partial [Bacilli bacterium]